MSRFTVACIQNSASADTAVNLKRLETLIAIAQDRGAQLICLPENCAAMFPTTAETLAHAQPESDNLALNRLRQLAAHAKAWLLIGSLLVRADGGEKVANRCFVIAPNGDIVARYDKIHLFDVQLPNAESYRESDYVAPGAQAVVVDLPFAKLGLSICYDLRFPHLYRYLAQQGADCLLVPAAFTQTTGAAHWHVLLRARAIETGCFVIAPAQYGVRTWGRATYGHSLIVDPWGEVLADGGESERVITAEIDLTRVREARQRIPSLHNNGFAGPSAP